ncbi:MAG: glycosyltransferase family 2 protein [Pseudomonadota bacterium]
MANSTSVIKSPAPRAKAAKPRVHVESSASLDGAPAIDLEWKLFTLHFSDEALISRAHVNLNRGDEVALHIKYVPIRGGFVLNDTADGVWREEVFVECLRVPGGAGLVVALAPSATGSVFEIPGYAPVSLDGRFDLSGNLHAVHDTVVKSFEGRVEATRQAGELKISRIYRAEDAALGFGIDAVVVSGSAYLIEGWVDDRKSRLVGLSMLDYDSGERASLAMGRIRRTDVDSHLAVSKPGEFGFWAIGFGSPEHLDKIALSFVFEDESGVPFDLVRRIPQSSSDFFATVLATFGRRSVMGDLTARSFSDLDGGLGEIIGKLHRQLSAQRAVTNSSHFGRTQDVSVSLICVLYGFPDFLYLLVSQFAKFSTLTEFEFIFVNNSPDLNGVLMRDAELASYVFGADIRLISLNQNTGFSYANNVGVAAARGRTVAIINPDVFPRDRAAVDRLRELGQSSPGNDILGGKLYYADGSVMHEGMYFDKDQKLSALCGVPVWTVEHFRKGFPDSSVPVAREVPALTGALLVLEKDLYQRLNGFSTDYIFGHYEDADLCLRVNQAGGRVILDPALSYWHYEGMGSIKQPEHIGSGLYNRWLFARSWGIKLKESD